MRYIFTESEDHQKVIDIQNNATYHMISARTVVGHPRVIIKFTSIDESLENDMAISFWQQLAIQVDQRCGIKDVRERMEAFAEGASDD